MYRILVVDDDQTCLTVVTACLKKLNYQVMPVSCGLEALNILVEKGENGEKTRYDMVLTDVHMPIMDGFQLLWHVQRDFNIPVVLMSADDKTETMCKGLGIGAPAYYLKPIKLEDVKDMWQFCELLKNDKRKTAQENIPKTICSSSSTNTTEDKLTDQRAFLSANARKKKTKTKVWTAQLHSRFAEVILILGLKNAVPKNILNGMNAPSLTREQVGSHLQKFRQFMDTILDGTITLEESSKKWMDYNYYSSVVGGNPNLILIQQFFEQRRTGNWPAPIPAFLPLPPFKAATPTVGNSIVPFQGASNVVANMYMENVGGSSGPPIFNDFMSEQPFNVGWEANNNLSSGTSFNPHLQFGSVQLDPSIGSSLLETNELGNAFAIPGNEQAPQLNGGAGMADTSSLIHSNAGVSNNPAAAAQHNKGEDWDDLLWF